MEVYCPPPLKTGGEGMFLIQSHNFSRQLPRLEVLQLFRATRGLFHSPEDEQGPAFIQNRPLVMQEIWQGKCSPSANKHSFKKAPYSC